MDNHTGETIMPLGQISGPQIDAMNLLEELVQKILGYWIPQEKFGFAIKPPRYDAYVEFMKGQKLWAVDWDKAFYHFQEAYRIDTTFTFALLKQASVLLHMGKYAEAESLFQQIKARKPDMSEYDQSYLEFHLHSLHGRLKEKAIIGKKNGDFFLRIKQVRFRFLKAN
ncbi:MAG: hypothetical protein R3B93_09840 [Bacteroidia bacterium]